MVQVYYCPWTFYNDHMCSVVRNEIYTCIAISWIVSTPISICDASHLSKLWKLKALCSVKPCRHCDVITIKINQVKICFSLSKLNLRNDLKFFNHIIVGKVTRIARIAWYQWDCSFVLHCHSIWASIFGIFAVTTFFFVLYKKIKILQCVAYQLSPLTAPFVCGQMCICVCSFIIIAAIGLMFAVFNRSPSFFSFATSSFTFHLNTRMILLNWKNYLLICNKCLWDVCMTTLHNYLP